VNEVLAYLLAAGTPLVLLLVVSIRVAQVRKTKRRRAAKRRERRDQELSEHS